MSNKLNQSLDEIVKTQRGNNRRITRARHVTRTKAITPAAGVGKKTKEVQTTKVSKNAAKNGANPIIPAKGESKVVVTGLPSDVSEQQIKEYFGQTVGPVKKAFLTYGPNGQSRGVATVVFNKPGSAVEAATNLNGVKIDNRAIKVEVILGAKQTPLAAPAKSLGDRVAQPKNQPKPASGKATPKSAVAKPNVQKAKRGTQKQGRRAIREKPKTAEQLDADMTDYFDNAIAANGNTTTDGEANTADMVM